MTVSTPNAPVQVDSDLVIALQKAFGDFQLRAEQLDSAYRAMQEDFKKVNIELERKNNELAESLKKQRETQTYLNSILESMNNGVIGVDIMGTVTHFNRAAALITGHKVSEVLGQQYEQVFNDRGTPELSLMSVLRAGREAVHDEKVLWHTDGHPVPVSFQTAMLRDEHQTALGAVEVFTDVSRIKALEEEMQNTRTMAALGEMSATVAHEIRNPLGAMGMWAGLLERDLEAGDPRGKILGKITEGLARLNRIVSNLLVYTRPVKAAFRKVNLIEVVEETVDFIEIEVERQEQVITVRKVWQADTPALVMADPEKMQQVLMNLCLNATQAMPQGGTLEVEVAITRREQSELVSFRISDTGVGIEAERLEKIFDPFHTSKENGTGLGLAIVKKFIEFHSGYIDVKSEVGKGTDIRVFLPGLPMDRR